MNLLELAKQGDVKAIAALLNRFLKPKGISVKVHLKDGCLQLMLESAQVPNKQALVGFIYKEITKLEATSIQKVKIYWRQTGQDFPAWIEALELTVKEVTTPPCTTFSTENPNKLQNQQNKTTTSTQNSEVSNQVAVGIIKAFFCIIVFTFVIQSFSFLFEDQGGDMREFADRAEQALERVKQAKQELCEKYPDTDSCTDY